MTIKNRILLFGSFGILIALSIPFENNTSPLLIGLSFGKNSGLFILLRFILAFIVSFPALKFLFKKTESINFETTTIDLIKVYFSFLISLSLIEAMQWFIAIGGAIVIFAFPILTWKRKQ